MPGPIYLHREKPKYIILRDALLDEWRSCQQILETVGDPFKSKEDVAAHMSYLLKLGQAECQKDSKPRLYRRIADKGL